MNRKTVLLKTAQFAKKHRLKTNTIVIMFAVIILSCYFKDFICKAIRCIFKPFSWILMQCKNFLKRIFRPAYSFCKNHKLVIVKLECVFLTVSFILLYVFNNNYLQSVWGENTGAFSGDEIGNVSGEEENTMDIVLNSQLVSDDKKDIDTDEDETGAYAGETGEEQVNEAESESTEANIEDKLPKVLLDQPLYYICLNRKMNTVTIYTYDESGEYNVPIKAMRCSTGGDETPLGTFALSDKFKFAALQYNSYGQYCSRITGAILFHSSTYTALQKDTLSAEDYNLLGESVSHGCIRLTTEDAKWIYDNCDEGTVVTIYDDDYEGPLGKPETIKVPEGTLWDPTDPDPENPWATSMPVISGASNREVYEYDNYDIMDGITAIDTCGNDITDDIIVDGSVDVNVPGIYTITYRVTDLLGRKDEVTVEIVVK